MTQRVHKVVVTNESALKAKYGAAGWTAIHQAVNGLIAADQQRGLNTLLVGVDNKAHMAKCHGKPVARSHSPLQNKQAIDKVYRTYAPDYLLILGSIDVIPHQDLRNPLYGHEDPDKTADSDLPYACETPHNQKIEDFRGPTRVVGRLPDLTGGTAPDYLIGLLNTAANYRSQPRSVFDAHLGISAKVWRESTARSLSNIFGTDTDLQTAPPMGPKWPVGLIKSRAHFINCHGAAGDSHFYGQEGETDYPVAHDAAYLAGKVKGGTVCAAECCYGAELYDPQLSEGQPGICSTYLAGGAYGFFGSSTIAYGPAVGNAQADLLTQYFLQHVLAGASLGRAALQARQDFVLKIGVLDPADLKTLAQFNLLGDPSVHPVERKASDRVPLAGPTPRGARGAKSNLGALGIRREMLLKNGLAIAAAANHVMSEIVAAVPKKIQARLQAHFVKSCPKALAGVTLSGFLSFAVHAPPPLLPAGTEFAKGVMPAPPTAVHVGMARLDDSGAKSPRIVLVIAREQHGDLVIRTSFSR